MGPDFLCIGAQKAGTSWLHHNLAQQPGVWVPAVKELHYLADNPKDRLSSRLVLRRPSHRLAFRRGLRSAMRPWSAVDRGTAAWAVRFLAFPRTDRGYEALFPTDSGVMSGEMTPTYALLPEVAIERLATINPQLRIVYLLRNPVDRAWSDANMRVRKEGLVVDFDTCGSVARDLLTAPSQLAHADYVGNLERWKRFFPGDHFHVAFFDDLLDNPTGLFRDVSRFLGIDESDIRVPPDVDRPRNSRHTPPVPDATFRVLATTLAPYIDGQHRYFDNDHTARWTKSCAAGPVSDDGGT